MIKRNAWQINRGWGDLGDINTFSPLSLTNLRAWYKSDTGISIATGVNQWSDQSGNNNHLLQATGGAQPTVTSSAINGLPAISFDGTDDFMRASFTLVQPETIFIMFRQDAWSAANRCFDGVTTATMILQQNTVSPQLRLFAGSNGNTNPDLSLSVFGLATCIFNNAAPVLQINNGTEIAGTIGAGGAGAGGLTLGASGGGAPSQFTKIAVAEVIVMAAIATAAERSNVRSYMQTRYGVGA